MRPATCQRWVMCRLFVLVCLQGIGLPCILAGEGVPADSVLVGNLKQRFDGYFADAASTKAYHQRVVKHCRRFPEGDLFPYIFPIYAYASLRLQQPAVSIPAQEQAAFLMQQAIDSCQRLIAPPAKNLLHVQNYKGHATYLGHTCLALHLYAHTWDDLRWRQLHKHLTTLLVQALKKAKGAPLRSFPHLCWTFDTIPCLLAVRLSQLSAGQTQALLQAYVAHQRGIERPADMGLPPSSVALRSGRALVGPRGCDLSWRIAFLHSLDAAFAQQRYRDFKTAFFLAKPPLYGFREWLPGTKAVSDVDSGPIIQEIGSTATTFGLAASRLSKDVELYKTLVSQAASTHLLLHAPIAVPGQADLRRALKAVGGFDAACFSGFLYGDTCLFHAMTICDWSPLAWDAVVKK